MTITERVGQLVRSLNQRMTVVVVEHDMAFVRSVAQRVVVFHQGRVLADGEPEAVLADARVREVYLGGTGSVPDGAKGEGVAGTPILVFTPTTPGSNAAGTVNNTGGSDGTTGG